MVFSGVTANTLGQVRPAGVSDTSASAQHNVCCTLFVHLQRHCLLQVGWQRVGQVTPQRNQAASTRAFRRVMGDTGTLCFGKQHHGNMALSKHFVAEYRG
jgi:hypothetical protein